MASRWTQAQPHYGAIRIDYRQKAQCTHVQHTCLREWLEEEKYLQAVKIVRSVKSLKAPESQIREARLAMQIPGGGGRLKTRVFNTEELDDESLGLGPSLQTTSGADYRHKLSSKR